MFVICFSHTLTRMLFTFSGYTCETVIIFNFTNVHIVSVTLNHSLNRFVQKMIHKKWFILLLLHLELAEIR